MVSVLKLFEELDQIIKPQDDDVLKEKTFKFNLERFLQTARTRTSQLSWSLMFHERMIQTQTILTLEKYNQYVECMKHYILLENNTSKTQQV